MQSYSTTWGFPPSVSQVSNAGPSTQNGSSCWLGIPGCSCLSTGTSQGNGSQNKSGGASGLGSLDSLRFLLQNLKTSETPSAPAEETNSKPSTPVSFKKGDTLRIPAFEGVVKSDSYNGQCGVWVYQDADDATTAAYVPFKLGVEVAHPVEVFEEGAAYEDAVGDVYLRAWDSEGAAYPWIDPDGDSQEETCPSRPLVKLVKSA